MVLEETESTSAVSSSVRPPKNRSSTTWPCSESSAASFDERVVQSNQVDRPRLGHRNRVEKVPRSFPTSFLRIPLARVLHEDPPHRLRGHGEKMRAILPFHPLPADEPQVGLVDDGGGLKRVAWSFPPEIPLGHSMQLAVDEGDQPVQGAPVPLPPGEEQPGDLAGGSGGCGGSIFSLRHSDFVLKPAVYPN